MRNILFILGTRPEAIKLAPLILAMRGTPDLVPVVCNTEQQRELSTQTLEQFGISADIRLDAMTPNQTLANLNARLLALLQDVFAARHFDAAIVQGDTMSVFAGACASFYNGVPVFHVEAGLRSFDLAEPFPEEALRQMATRICSLHFPPTQRALDNLLAEGVRAKSAILTGNTVVDALHRIPKPVASAARESLAERGVSLSDHPVLVTVHRRENHGQRLDHILNALSELLTLFPKRQFALPVHPNPNVREKVTSRLSKFANALLLPPLDYPGLVELQRAAHLILTDSGGIQEEAPTFGAPVLVLRYETERPEGVAAGFARLVGADEEKIVAESKAVLTQNFDATRISTSANPYGDGRASERIIDSIRNFFDTP